MTSRKIMATTLAVGALLTFNSGPDAAAQSASTGAYDSERAYLDTRFANTVFIARNAAVGLIRGIELNVSDQVGDGCWTDVDSVKARIRAELERSSVAVYVEPIAFVHAFYPRLEFTAVGFKLPNNVCVVSVSMKLNYPSSAELGSLTNTEKIVSVRALHEIWDRASVLTEVRSANESLMEWTQAAVDTLVADISQAKRDPDVISARAVWPDRPMQTQKEYEQELNSALQKQ